MLELTLFAECLCLYQEKKFCAKQIDWKAKISIFVDALLQKTFWSFQWIVKMVILNEINLIPWYTFILFSMNTKTQCYSWFKCRLSSFTCHAVVSTFHRIENEAVAKLYWCFHLTSIFLQNQIKFCPFLLCLHMNRSIRASTGQN